MYEIRKLRNIRTQRGLSLGIIFVGLLVSLQSVKAAELVITANAPKVSPGELFTIDVFINTDNDAINAVAGSLSYPPELTVADVRDAQSLINFWVERPGAKLTPGRLAFSGLTAGGISTRQGLIFSALFRVTSTPAARVIQLGITNAEILKSDGAGTKAVVTTRPLIINIAPGAALQSASTTLSSPPDTTPPEPFTPLVARDSRLFNGRWFAVWQTRDSGSGLNYYEMQETTALHPDPEAWQRAESPVALHDQTRQSYLYIRALDKAGTAQVEMVAPQPAPPWYTNYVFWCIIPIILLLLYAIGRLHAKTRPPVSRILP